MSSEVVICRFRVNSQLKIDFSDICKSNHTTLSNELRGFLKRSLESRSINYDSPCLSSYGASSEHSHYSKGVNAVQSVMSKVRGGDDGSTYNQATSDYQESFDLDTSCNFKVDSELKNQFSEFFSDSSLSSHLKRFMSHIVRVNK